MRVRILVPLVLLAGAVLPVTAASAATTYEVSVGRFLEGAPAESMRFLPGSIDVHQGDTLHFTSESFHTATVLPLGQGPVEWFDANAAEPGSPYYPLQPDPDDDSFKFNLAAALPSSFTCGAPAMPACSYDGSSVVNSGLPLESAMDFSVTVDVAAGSGFYVVCIIHGAQMRMKVNVVSGGEPASDPADVRAANAAAIEQDTNSAAALFVKYAGTRSWHRDPDGTKVWDAWAGVDNRHVTLYGMFPSRLTVRRGDTVQWHFDSLTFEDHTVTFPIDTAKDIVRNSFVVACDPDGDAGPGPDNPPDLDAFPFCGDPTQTEVDFDGRFVPPAGNGTFRGNDLETSGELGATSFQGDGNFDLRFGRTSSNRGFKYICLLHPFMRGRVVVR